MPDWDPNDPRMNDPAYGGSGEPQAERASVNADGWPEFETKQPLVDGRSWTAKFDSFDQYREYLYYLVKLYDGDKVARLVAQLDSSSYQGAWADEQQRRRLSADIAAVAASGESNTSYVGYNW
jgi:hypothetical protein